MRQMTLYDCWTWCGCMLFQCSLAYTVIHQTGLTSPPDLLHVIAPFLYTEEHRRIASLCARFLKRRADVAAAIEKALPGCKNEGLAEHPGREGFDAMLEFNWCMNTLTCEMGLESTDLELLEWVWHVNGHMRTHCSSCC